MQQNEALNGNVCCVYDEYTTKWWGTTVAGLPFWHQSLTSHFGHQIEGTC